MPGGTQRADCHHLPASTTESAGHLKPERTRCAGGRNAGYATRSRGSKPRRLFHCHGDVIRPTPSDAVHTPPLSRQHTRRIPWWSPGNTIVLRGRTVPGATNRTSSVHKILGISIGDKPHVLDCITTTSQSYKFAGLKYTRMDEIRLWDTI